MYISIKNMYCRLEHMKTCHKWFYALHFIVQFSFCKSTFRLWCLLHIDTGSPGLFIFITIQSSDGWKHHNLFTRSLLDEHLGSFCLVTNTSAVNVIDPINRPILHWSLQPNPLSGDFAVTPPGCIFLFGHVTCTGQWNVSRHKWPEAWEVPVWLGWCSWVSAVAVRITCLDYLRDPGGGSTWVRAGLPGWAQPIAADTRMGGYHPS